MGKRSARAVLPAGPVARLLGARVPAALLAEAFGVTVGAVEKAAERGNNAADEAAEIRERAHGIGDALVLLKQKVVAHRARVVDAKTIDEWIDELARLVEEAYRT